MKGRLSVATFGAALACAGLFGCGGGGGGGGGGSGLQEPPSTLIAISASNINQVTDASLDPAVGGTGAFGASTSSVDTPQPNTRALLRALQSVSRQAKQARPTSSGLSDVPVNESCPFGGTITGDETPTSATLRFNSCSPESGQVINGSASATVLINTSTRFQASFSLDVTFTQTGSQPLRLVGNFSIDENCPGGPGTCVVTFNGSSLGAAHGAEVWFIKSFNILSVEGPGFVDVSASYTVSSSDLGGSVQVITNTPIRFVSSAMYPESGQIRINGANGSNAVITINSSTPGDLNAVQVQVDLAPGDGTPDITSNFSWNALEAI
ncbi:MAG TPA: hypothetical protein VFB93_25490 [Burkholderiales bacterium]|nr:hypothetical protein [Burkholderiales bacterium]